MARPLLPDPLKRRHLLAAELAPERARELAEAYLSEGRIVDAIAFFAKADDRPGLEAIREQAIASGDVFLLREASVALRQPIGPDVWAAIGDAAERAGLDGYAEEARRQRDRPASGAPT